MAYWSSLHGKSLPGRPPSHRMTRCPPSLHNMRLDETEELLDRLNNAIEIAYEAGDIPLVEKLEFIQFKIECEAPTHGELDRKKRRMKRKR